MTGQRNSLKLAVSRLNQFIKDETSVTSWWAKHTDDGFRKTVTMSRDPDSWRAGYLKGLRMARTLVEDPDYFEEES